MSTQNLEVATPEITLDTLRALELEIAKLPPVHMPLDHIFADGVYIRQLWIPAGTVLTGKIHKSEHVSICAMGEITVMTPEGMKRVKAPYTVVCPPGTKRAAYAHTDTLWINVFKNADDARDVDLLESRLVEDEPYIAELNAQQRARYLLEAS
ncbi:MAG: hypothetical protein IT480_06475 [Gammaproteobacteria bacterium]|nr:hypothetical protein [Gammaproteobacteria bacterium]